MKTKILTLLPLENLEEQKAENLRQNANNLPHAKTAKRAGGRKRNWIDGSMIGKRFNSLTVIGKGVPGYYKSITLIPCKCDCGENVQILSTKIFKRKSCKTCSFKKIAKSKFKHGREPKDVYIIWKNMKARCSYVKRSNYRYYGGRGIAVCERWANSFENFINDMGVRPGSNYSIERVDNSKGYSPDNCKWATHQEQAKNKRSSILLNCRGQLKSITEWSVISGIKYNTIYFRIKNGWGIEKAIWFNSPHYLAQHQSG